MSQPDSNFTPEDLLAASPDAVVVHDLKDNILYWNQTAEEFYGWSIDEIQGRPVTRIFYMDTAARKEALGILLDAGKWEGNLRQMDRNGDEHLVRARQSLLRHADGSPYAILSFNTDVTEQMKVADAEARAHQVRSSSLLAGGVAHELNNALAPIMLSSAMLKRTIEDERSRNMISMIEKCANRGAELIADLMAFERGRGGGNESIRATQIFRAIRRAREELVPESVQVQIEVDDNLWECRGDLKELTHVFRHIIQNSCESMPEGGSLLVQAGNRLFDENFESLAPQAKAGAYVSFVFKDTGVGIEPDLLARVAEPFYTTKEPKKGHGFGLANSQAIVKGHKGFMVLDSEKGRGTTLSIFLPAAISPEGIKGSAPPFPISAEGNGKLILVADDEFFIRETIKRTLEERGYSVITAEDGTEALAVYAARINDVDLVVTNVEMPFMDGPALCRALKKLSPELPILVSSGHKQPDKMQEIRQTGVEDFLSKPYTADNLAERISKILHIEGDQG
ncbi:hybrid sensor histidine kinase/response regulator [Coraliomargarita parva]|uniref:hybrid sensor histidine kinase/response regulator n=1 Tax=Coraliomargarita parva TaxID=3014050 RepID=UPI0022B37F5E|nr:PAS domain-containing hybrid sensor histidine kinase/response regulator [Coraliomargarita parva]